MCLWLHFRDPHKLVFCTSGRWDNSLCFAFIFLEGRMKGVPHQHGERALNAWKNIWICSKKFIGTNFLSKFCVIFQEILRKNTMWALNAWKNIGICSKKFIGTNFLGKFCVIFREILRNWKKIWGKIRCNFKDVSGNSRRNFWKFLEKFRQNRKKLSLIFKKC